MDSARPFLSSTIKTRKRVSFDSCPPPQYSSSTRLPRLTPQFQQSRHRSRLLGAVAATASLVTILKIALDRPRPPAELVVEVPLSSDAFPSGHTTDGSVLVLASAIGHSGRTRPPAAPKRSTGRTPRRPATSRTSWPATNRGRAVLMSPRNEPAADTGRATQERPSASRRYFAAETGPARPPRPATQRPQAGRPNTAD